MSAPKNSGHSGAIGSPSQWLVTPHEAGELADASSASGPKAATNQIRDPNRHAARRIEWKVLESEGRIERPHIVIQRMREHAEAASIEPIESSEAFRVMEDFVDQCGDDRLARALEQALRQRKPFRRFKDALAAHPAQREAWFAFERQAMEAIARRWCEGHGISPRWDARPDRPTP